MLTLSFVSTGPITAAVHVPCIFLVINIIFMENKKKKKITITIFKPPVTDFNGVYIYRADDNDFIIKRGGHAKITTPPILSIFLIFFFIFFFVSFLRSYYTHGVYNILYLRRNNLKNRSSLVCQTNR